VVIVAPTDHYIADEDAFDRALHSGVTAAERGAIVTFGVVPTRPATVYGYIEVGGTVTSAPAPLEVLRFHEKPGAAEAAAYLATGRFLWNAGIFAWRASVFERALGDADPALAARIAALPPAWAEHGPEEHPAEGSPAVSQEFAEAWNRLPAISVDYALLEKASGIRLIPLSAGWSDVGGWDAAAELLPADDLGNRQADATLYVGASDCSVHRLGAERLIALVGTEGIIVVETPDSVLVCKKGSGEALREVVRRLAAAGREDLL
jgi:mannose-1-phosphate guanylyltransferase